MLKEDFDKDYLLLMAFDQGQTDDRSLAIVYTSYAEKYIATLIQFRMKGLNQKLKEKLFKPEGLLGPLQAKVDIAKALNILNDEMFNDMVVLGSMRNKFAHHLDIVTFDHPEITKRIKNLKLTPERYPQGVPGWSETPVEKWSMRDRFRFSATTICSSLHLGMEGVTGFTKHRAED